MREPRPVLRVELSETNKKLRLILAIVLLVIAAVAITAGFTSLLNKDTGWQRVEVTTTERNNSRNFVFQYEFSGSGANATAVHKQISALYGEGCVKTYQLFTAEEEVEGVHNMHYLNAHPNEVVDVDPLLYSAFQKLEDTRYLYLGPVYAYYDNVIFSTGETMVEQLDPATGEEAKAYVAQLAAFAADENAVQLELLGNNQVKLHISQEYLAFAQENEIDRFLDFHYLTNAFAIDYLADTMIQSGFTKGYLVSNDGYTRNLDAGNTYRFNLFDRVETLVYPAGVMEYRGPVSLVFLKDYPTADSDAFYRENGLHFIHGHADIADGMYKANVPNLVGYSYELSCVDVLLKMLPQFISDETFTAPEGIYSVWFEDRTIFYNDRAITVTDLLSEETVRYQAKLVG